jgi:hypothetical protein
VFLGEENPRSQKREGKEKVPNPVLSLEEIDKAKGLSVELLLDLEGSSNLSGLI